MRLCLKCYRPCDVREVLVEDACDYGEGVVMRTTLHEYSDCCGRDYREMDGAYFCSVCQRWCGLTWGCVDGYQVPASLCCRADVNRVGDVPTPYEALRARVERVA